MSDFINGQKIYIRMTGTDKFQAADVHGDDPESQYIETTQNPKFVINMKYNRMNGLYQIIQADELGKVRSKV
jgi:hypothetical protein